MNFNFVKTFFYPLTTTLNPNSETENINFTHKIFS